MTSSFNTRRMMHMLSVLLSLSFLLNVFLLFTSSVPTQHETLVIGVIDGDTIVLEGKIRVRLRHVDSPELEYCGGKQAKELLESLVVGKTVRLEELIPDQRGRGMALIFNGNKLINQELLASGWSRYHSDNSTKKDILKHTADTSKLEKKGLFELCHSVVHKSSPECMIKGNIDDNAPSTSKRKFYTPDCAQYSFTIVEEDMGEQWFCSEHEAIQAGFKKAETCK
jgi:micrococcal nuclease